MSNIIFKSVTYKNFLSTGNVENRIILNKSATTLVVGKNGEGKSTIVEAIVFGIFGKPFRDIRLNQLINSINGKQLLVTIEFDVGNKEYKVIRGMKPNIFEIYENGIMLNQESASKDYQKILEQQIIRSNYKTFTQIVILGSASFVPFMQLKSAQRREVVEDVLDIRIFSVMNQLLKERISITKDTITKLDNDIKIARTKVDSQTAIIKTITTAKTDTIGTLHEKIKNHEKDIQNFSKDIQQLTTEIQQLSQKTASKDYYEETISDITTTINSYVANEAHHKKHIHFFNENNVCSTCTQEINEDYKQQVLSELTSKLTAEQDLIQSHRTTLSELNKELKEIRNNLDIITDKNIKLSTCNYSITMLNKSITDLNDEIERVTKDTTNIDEEKRKLKELATATIEKINQKTELLNEKAIQDVSSQLLKDTGIKTAIIREYLPVMNQLINKYLAIMDTYIQFNLDESFNETIKSRFRDDFTYASFSEGEKKKLDVAILFAWRQIARMKNSISTNLLIMDEVMEGSLDNNATESLLQLLNEISIDANIFVISHKGDILNDKFHSILRIEKRNDFSVIA